jgi:site-specific recombinase XerD
MVKTEEIISSILMMVENGSDLKNSLWIILSKYKIEEDSHEIVCGNDNYALLKKFIATKKFEGRSDKTLEQYVRENNRFLQHCQKDVKDITKDDIMSYLADLQIKNKCNMTTVCNSKRYISSFFNWMDDEGYIQKSPTRNIKSLKCPKSERKAFTNCEIEKMRDNVKNIRDRALIELLLSTGCRVGEIEIMNCEDINWLDKSIKVRGKGNKERIVYFNEITAMYLEKYLQSRNDNNNALFVSRRKNNTRLKVASIETIIRNIGHELNIHSYPHKFRRTYATRAIKNKMPIATLSKLMGHDKIETTMIYCDISKDQLKLDYTQFIDI